MKSILSGTGSVLKREFSRLCQSKLSWMLCFVLPILSSLLVLSLFSERNPRNLPISVCDRDLSALSRLTIRSLDASPGLCVRYKVSSPPEGEEQIRRGSSYALVVIPSGFERDIKRGRNTEVMASINTQWLLPGNLVSRDIRQVFATLSAVIEMRLREKKGESAEQVQTSFEPIRSNTHALFNPQFDYIDYLVTALISGLFQIFVLIQFVFVLGIELRDGTARSWYATSNGNVWKALIGKTIPYIFIFAISGLITLTLPLMIGDLPFRGSLPVLYFAQLLMITACLSYAVMIVGFTANMRLSGSLAAFFSGPALAFSGITFPLFSMPGIAQGWSFMLPLTHYLNIQTALRVRGADLSSLIVPFAFLFIITLLGPILTIHRWDTIMIDERYWRRP